MANVVVGGGAVGGGVKNLVEEGRTSAGEAGRDLGCCFIGNSLSDSASFINIVGGVIDILMGVAGRDWGVKGKHSFRPAPSSDIEGGVT